MSTITWETARAAGFVAYLLVTTSVAMGLVLSLKWRTGPWTRFVTTELHRFVTLLSLVFVGVHGVAVLVDPFIKFTPLEILVPLVSHYRPIWMALGIVAAYLMVAVWLSERIQKRIGYAWWRRLHYLTFLAFVLVTVHGIATGSDTRTWWALAVYGAASALVGGLLAVRLLQAGPNEDARQAWALVSVSLVAAIAVFTWLGPLRPGWTLLAGGGTAGAAGTGGSQDVAGATSGANDPAPQAAQLSPIQSRFTGTWDESSSTVRAQLSDGTNLAFQLQSDGASISAIQAVVSEPGAPDCTGTLQPGGRGRYSGTCTTADGRQLNVELFLRGGDDDGIRGTIVAVPA